MKKILYAFTAILMLVIQFQAANAQSWQWAKRGGGSAYGINSTDVDDLKGIVIDKHGNSYLLANFFTDKLSGDIDVDGNKLGKGGGDSDFGLISFDCTGKYRWSKIISGPMWEGGYDIKLDSLGGIYISAGFVTSFGDTVKFSTDTIIGNAPGKRQYKRWLILKYDTAGNYKWMRLPEPDTISTYSKSSASFTMDVTPNGTLSLLSYITLSGAFCGGSYIVSPSATPALHMLKYDANGNFIKGFPMEISEGDVLSLCHLRMVWDTKNDLYYILSINEGSTGVIYPKFGSTKMTGTNCLAKFNNLGKNIWVRQSSTSWYTGVISSTPVIDNTGNIYISTSEGGGGNFLGYNIINKYAGTAVPCVFKVNPSGTLIWGKNGSSSSAAKGLCIAVSPTKDEVAFAGGYLVKFYWDKDSMYGSPSNGFFIRLKASDGSTISVDSIYGGGTEWPDNIAVDKRGNYYVGGEFTGTLTVNGLSTVSIYGGRNDIYTVKFGEADCKEPVSINENVKATSSIKIYPNPAQDVITFEGLEKGSEVRLFSVLGQQVQNFSAKSNKEQVAINHLASGMYLVQIHNTDGEIYSAKIVKE